MHIQEVMYILLIHHNEFVHSRFTIFCCDELLRQSTNDNSQHIQGDNCVLTFDDITIINIKKFAINLLTNLCLHVHVFLKVTEVHQTQRNWDSLCFVKRDLNHQGSFVNNPPIVVQPNSCIGSTGVTTAFEMQYLWRIFKVFANNSISVPNINACTLVPFNNIYEMYLLW